MSEAWYENFFHGIALDLWRGAVSPEHTRAEADFLEAVLEPPSGARLLDVPCGNGRHALELAGRGHRLTGLDISEEFLEEARGHSKQAGLSVEWVQADMRELEGDGIFDGAYCFGNSFGYADYEGTRRFLSAVGRALKPGARFAIDTGMAAESILPGLAETDWVKVGDILLLLLQSYVAEDSRLDTEYTFVRDGKTETRTASNLIFTVAELKRMLAAAGLEVDGLHGSLNRRPYELGDERLLVVARKG